MRAYRSLWMLCASGLFLGCPVIILPEDCDNNIDDDLDGRVDCQDSDCRFAAVCNPDTCGDGVINSGEECDGANLGGFDCGDFGFDAGTLACDSACNFNTNFCYDNDLCPNGVIDPGEDCDGSNLGGFTCEDFGANAGTLSCDPFCEFDLSDCALIEICHNGIDDDGDDFVDCQDAECEGDPGCPFCGNAIVEQGEECDDGNQSSDDGCDAYCQWEYGFCNDNTIMGPGWVDFRSNDTAGSTDQINRYGCVGWLENGPEYAYLLVASSTETMTASLGGLSADLDLFIIEDPAGDFACSSELSCIAYGDESVSWPAQLGHHYFIVVDGFQGAVSNYSLTVSAATPSVCGNGIIESDEECDDGNTNNGDGCASYCELEAGTCSEGWTLVCDTGDTWNTTAQGSTDLVDRYGCTTWNESGREYTYKFTAPADGTIDVTLTPVPGVDLDIFVLLDAGFGCVAGNCIGYGDNSVTVAVQRGTIYYFVVDGYNGAQGDYNIALDCSF